MSVASEWQMPRPGKTCAGCRRGFEDGETFQALLDETPEGYERRDYCLDCPPPAEPVPIATWKAHRPPAQSKKPQTFDREAVYSFFLRLEDADEPEKLRLRFVLALLLWRKKVLKFTQSTETDGGETWEFSTPRTGENHHVHRPELDEEQLERLSLQLEHLLAGSPGEPGLTSAAQTEEHTDA